MIASTGLDTNVLARYYVADDETQGRKQRELARALIESGQPLAACKTVLLELEWVLRGYYGFGRADIIRVYQHLLSLPHVEVEDRPVVEQAVDAFQAGLDFADALHHASYTDCAEVATFDDRGYARRAARLKMQPQVRVPQP